MKKVREIVSILELTLQHKSLINHYSGLRKSLKKTEASFAFEVHQTSWWTATKHPKETSKGFAIWAGVVLMHITLKRNALSH